MSCLWTWCCRVHEDASDTDSKGTEEQQIETTKKGKKKRRRSQWRIHWKKERKNNFNKDEETEDQRLINQQPAKVEEEAHVLGLPVGLASSLENVSAETLEATAPPPQDHLTKEEDAAVQHLMETLLEEVGTCTEQLLKAETMQITVADEAAAEATNSTMGICLEGCEEKHLGKVIRELLDILFDDALSASLQPLAENEHMDTNLAEIEEETVEKHLDHPVSSNKGVADAIRELLDIMFDDALSASLQPLENDQMDTKPDKTEEETVEKHLDHLESSNKDAADAIRELLEITFDDVLSASLQPLEKDVISIIEAESQPEATENRLNVCLEESQDPENQCLNIEKSHRPEEEKTNKKKTRRGTRGKGRKINYKKEKYPHDELDGQRGSRGSSGQTNNSAFESVKSLLCSSPVLAAPNFARAFKLEVDASCTGAGAVLLQEDSRGIDHPVCYFSKKFAKHQLAYSTIEKEALALLLALQHFEVYLGSSSDPVFVFTDHNPLTFLHRMSNSNRRLMRWSLIVQGFILTIRHKKGSENIVADTLSRC
ncbi:hypothetical protein MHYP_G00061320 [Metynnis hypsauchen]